MCSCAGWGAGSEGAATGGEAERRRPQVCLPPPVRPSVRMGWAACSQPLRVLPGPGPGQRPASVPACVLGFLGADGTMGILPER